MRVTYFGTTMLMLDDGKSCLLFDCHTSRPPMAKMVFGRIETDTALADQLIDRYDMKRIAAIFISHSHHDHVLDLPYFARAAEAEVYGSESTLNVARGGKVPEDRLHLFGKKWVGIGSFRVRIIPSIHSKAHWYNDDLGQTIDRPLAQPARKKEYKEGGSYDFLVENRGRTYLIRPSFNYIKGQLDGISADVLFLGIAGLGKADEETKRIFFAETVEKVSPKMVIPLHWDNFLKPLTKQSYLLPRFAEKTEDAMFEMAAYCGRHGIACPVVLPLTYLDLP